MPIVETHSAFSIPKTNISLWKYMDIPGFLSLLVDDALTFIRADRFEDRYEGALPVLTANQMDEDLNKVRAETHPTSEYVKYSEHVNRINMQVYLNCWCNESYEMVHMWKIYSKEVGVAIQTDYESLKQSIMEPENNVFPSLVQYVDFETEYGKGGNNLLVLYTQKRAQYKSENEFRLILPWPRLTESAVLGIEDEEEGAKERKRLYLETPVVKCKVDTNILIKRLHVSPYAPSWHVPLIQDIASKYGLSASPITQSKL
jgi:hypothetical protein